MGKDHVLVVGGTKGLGRIVAKRFLERGCVVSLLSRNRPQDLGSAAHIGVDLETLKDASDVVAQADRIGGALRYLVFCQRYRGEGDAWQGEIQVGLTATRLLVEAFSGHFCDEGDRAIAMVSSVYAQFVGGSQPAGYPCGQGGPQPAGALLCLGNGPQGRARQRHYATHLYEARIAGILRGQSETSGCL